MPDAGKIEFDDFQPQPLSKHLPLVKHLSDVDCDDLVNFLEGLLALSPSRRLTSEAACDQPYITGSNREKIDRSDEDVRRSVLSVLDPHLQAAADRYEKLSGIA